MNWRILTPVALVVLILFGGCGKSPGTEQDAASSVPNVITSDIQAGIEKHIDEQTRAGDGFYRIDHEGDELKLKLVRVHTEYLANLGPRYHFACIDMATPDGDVYDIDFFLAGDPGNMTVTETTVHKFNGQPNYAWKQNRDKTWHRIEVDDAPPEVLGAIQGTDQFEFLYQATLPELTDSARMWIPIPTTDAFQTVEVKSIKTPGTPQMLTDSEHGNSVMFLNLDAGDSGKTVEIRCEVQRREKGVYESKAEDPKQYLNPENRVPADDRITTIATDGYHCWAEFYTDGKWWPVDISEGDKCSPLSTYYFGHHPANRVELSRGRDLILDPGPASGPINFLAYPVLEIDGKPKKAKVVFSFTRNLPDTL